MIRELSGSLQKIVSDTYCPFYGEALSNFSPPSFDLSRKTASVDWFIALARFHRITEKGRDDQAS